MNKRALLPLLMGLLLLPLGCADPTGPPQVLQPSELCSDHSAHDIATFEDALLEREVRRKLNLGAEDSLTCGLISGLRGRFISTRTQIQSLVGIQNLTSLQALWLNNNSITYISALSGLTSLELLFLSGNLITDISALSGLTNLWLLYLNDNSITDVTLSGLTSLGWLDLSNNANLTNIQPLLDSDVFTNSVVISLNFTNVSCTDVGALIAKGFSVRSHCP